MLAKQPEQIEVAEEKERLKEQDDYLEEALEETFPASDPIAPGHPMPRRAVPEPGRDL